MGKSRFGNLTSLDLRNNNISDLSPLAGLEDLNYVNLDYNNISDISPLAMLKNLGVLRLNNANPISTEQVEWLRQQLPDCEIYFSD